jgi:hypothetical protein
VLFVVERELSKWEAAPGKDAASIMQTTDPYFADCDRMILGSLASGPVGIGV